MPLMHSPGGRQRIVPDRAVESYRARGWTSDGDPDPPNVADVKADWVAYAVGQGYDESEGLTKAELVERYG